MYVCIIAARKRRDAHSPSIFAGYRLSQQVRQYPYQQLVGPLPQTVAHGALTLRTPKGHEWKWEKSFLADLLGWLRALTWPEEPGTVTFLELAIDFEEFAQRTLPHAPQAKYAGHTLSLQERGRVLRLAMSSAQRLVTSGQLHPAGMVTRCGSLVPLGGPAICGLNKRPYFARREAMISHIRKLVQYCEEQWVAKAGTHRTHALRPYTYRPRKTAAEIEAHSAGTCRQAWRQHLVHNSQLRVEPQAPILEQIFSPSSATVACHSAHTQEHAGTYQQQHRHT